MSRVILGSLFWRTFAVNAALLTAATVTLALSPATVSFPVTTDQILVLVGGLLIMLATNVVLLRASLAPLRRLAGLMGRIDPLRPGERIEVEGAQELRAVTTAFNRMLDRLERERRASSTRTVTGQELERQRVATDLHDEVGQGLTALLLQLRTLTNAAPQSMRPGLAAAQDLARLTLDEIRRIARNLRPAVLDDLGLPYAIHALLDAYEGLPGLEVERAIDVDAPALPDDVELALWRMTQEALANLVHHAEATRAIVSLRTSDDRRHLHLSVEDDGRGLIADPALERGGIRGMRERALAIGADLAITSEPGNGTRVAVTVPLDAA